MSTRRTALLLANVVGFQAVWLACVAGAGRGLPWAGPAAALLFTVFTLGWGGKPRQDLRLLIIAVPLGWLLDSGFAASGWLVYAQAWPWTWVAPAWIGSLWIGFALTLNHSMAFLRHQPWLAAAFGAVGGPLAYWTAARAFDAVDFGQPMAWVLAALALGWALILPLLFWTERRFVGIVREGSPA